MWNKKLYHNEFRFWKGDIAYASELYETSKAYDMISFRLITEVSASPTFFGWVFGFGGKVQILAPESVREQYKQMIMSASEEAY